MISLLLFFLLLSSGSVFATAFFGKKYEETVPMTAFSAVVLVFLAGLIDQLRLGVYLVCVICAVLYLLSIWRTVQDKSLKTFCCNTFTPAFFIFLILCVLYAACLTGRVAWQEDEFSFWAISVKQMWHLDAYSCTLDTAAYVEYPPGMQIFEFILLVLNGSFSEWHMQYAYMILILLYALPFLNGLRWREPLKILGVGAVIFCAGTIFYPTATNNLMVDFALSCTFGYAMAVILLSRKVGRSQALWALANVAFAGTMMILIKQAGKLFAAISLLSLLACWGWEQRDWLRQKQFPKLKRMVPFGLLLLLPIVIAALWSWKYHLSPAPIAFDAGKYDWKEFFLILLRKTDGGYRASVFVNFINYIISTRINIGFLSMTYLQVFFVLTILMAVLYILYQKKGERLSRLAVSLTFACFFLYLLGLVASYMYTFSEGEAKNLASIDRYVCIYLSALLYVLLFLMYRALAQLQIGQAAGVIALVGLLCFVSHTEILNILLRSNVEYSISRRAPLQTLCDQIYADSEARGDEDVVLLINRTGYPHWPLNHFAYLLYPDYIVPWECSYGSELMFEGDYYTQILDVDGFLQHVYDLGADYIAINDVDQNFTDLYAGLFDTLLANGQVYRVTEEEIPFQLLKG